MRTDLEILYFQTYQTIRVLVNMEASFAGGGASRLEDHYQAKLVTGKSNETKIIVILGAMALYILVVYDFT